MFCLIHSSSFYCAISILSYVKKFFLIKETLVLRLQTKTMKFSVLYCILSLLSYCVNAQISASDYEVINAALSQIRKDDSSFFLLENKTYPCRLRPELENNLPKELKGKIQTAKFNEIVRNSKVKTQPFYIFNSDQIQKGTGIHLISPSRVDSIQRNKDIRVPLNKRTFFICSLPVYDKKKEFAVIDFGGGTAWLEMTGGYYLFKRKGSQWILIGFFGGWSS